MSECRPTRSSTDIYSPAKRSRIMSRVRAKNTAPEITARRIIHRMGSHGSTEWGKSNRVLDSVCLKEAETFKNRLPGRKRWFSTSLAGRLPLAFTGRRFVDNLLDAAADGFVRRFKFFPFP
jgi:hypothetical protein